MILRKIIDSNIYTSYLSRSLKLITRKQKRKGFWIFFATLASSAAEVLGLAFIVPVLYLIVEPAPIQNNAVMNAVYRFSGIGSESHFIFALIGILVLLFAFKNLLAIWVYYLQNRCAFDVSLDLIERQADNFIDSTYLEVQDENSNVSVRNIANVPSEFAKNMLIPLLKITNELCVLFIIVTVLIVFDYRIFILLCSIALPLVYIILRTTRKKAQQAGNRRNELEPRAYQSAFETVFSFEDIKTFHKQEFFVNRIKENFRELYNAFLWIFTLQRIPNRALETVIVLVIFLLFGWVVLVMKGSPDWIFMILLLFATAAYRVMPSLNEILSSMILMRSSAYVFDILSIEEKTGHPDRAGEVIQFDRIIELEGIRLQYEGMDREILSGLNLSIKKGDHIGIHGESGSGKSSLARVLMMLIPPAGGNITADGKPVNDPRRWHQLVSLVQQDFYLLDGTIAENIAFGIESKDIDPIRLDDAINQSGLETVLAEAKDGKNTVIGEFGTKLSGGQKQRLAIARALYKGAEILIFDESTNSLDSETERSILETLAALNRSGRTIIFISHKKEVLDTCKRTFLLTDGELQEQSTDVSG